MNTHVPKQIIEKYPNMEFRGKIKDIKNRKMIQAKNHNTGQSFYYSFEEDFFWFKDCEIPDWKIF